MENLHKDVKKSNTGFPLIGPWQFCQILEFQTSQKTTGSEGVGPQLCRGGSMAQRAPMVSPRMGLGLKTPKAERRKLLHGPQRVQNLEALDSLEGRGEIKVTNRFKSITG